MNKNLLFLVLFILPTIGFSQVGTTISYEDNFGSGTLNYNGDVNGRPSYQGPAGGVTVTGCHFCGIDTHVDSSTIVAPLDDSVGPVGPTAIYVRQANDPVHCTVDKCSFAEHAFALHCLGAKVE